MPGLDTSKKNKSLKNIPKKDNCEDPEIIMPKTRSKIEFKNIAKQTKVPYSIIADFES